MVAVIRPGRRGLVIVGVVALAVLGGGGAYAAVASGSSHSAAASAHAATVRGADVVAQATPSGKPTGAPTERPSGAPGHGGPWQGGPATGGFGGGHPAGRGGFGPAAGGGFGVGIGGGLLHATEVRATSAGTETDDLQMGAVTAVSATSLTVKSSDGYVATYVVNSSTHQSQGFSRSTTAPVIGKQVFVNAVQSSDGTKTAATVFTLPTGGFPGAHPSPSVSSTTS